MATLANAQIPDLLETTSRRPAPTQVHVDRAQIELTRIEAARRAEEVADRKSAQRAEYARLQRQVEIINANLQAQAEAADKAKSEYAKQHPSAEFQKQLEAQEQREAKQQRTTREQGKPESVVAPQEPKQPEKRADQSKSQQDGRDRPSQ